MLIGVKENGLKVMGSNGSGQIEDKSIHFKYSGHFHREDILRLSF